MLEVSIACYQKIIQIFYCNLPWLDGTAQFGYGFHAVLV